MKHTAKKISSIIVATALLLSVICVAFVAQAATVLPAFSVSDVYQARPGDTITVTVDVNENRGYCAGEFLISYDKDVLTPVSITAGEAASEYFASNTEYASGKAFFAVISEDLMRSQGTVATLTFEAKEGTVLYSGDITLAVNSLVGNTAVGYGLNSVRSTATGGEVHIAKRIFVPDASNSSLTEELEVNGYEDGYILSGTTSDNLTQQNISNNFSSFTAEYLGADGTTLSAATKLTTGCEIKIFSGSTLVDTFTVSVQADVDGDYDSDAEDAYLALLVVNGICSAEDLSPERRHAADADGDGDIDAADVELLRLKGLIKQ